MTTPPVKAHEDRRPGYVKAWDKRLKAYPFPKCYGLCPDVGGHCPPEDEFKTFLNEHKNFKFKDIPASWECRTCIYIDTL